MLTFTSNMVIKSKIEDAQRRVNRYVYQAYLVEVAGLEMYALFDIRQTLDVGDCIQGQVVQLVEYDEEDPSKALALRVSRFEKIDPEEFVPDEHLNVLVNGKLLKPNNNRLQSVGVAGKPFMPCTLSIKDDQGKIFRVFVVAFNDVAKRIQELETGTFVNLNARLHKQIKRDGFELNVSSLEVVQKVNN